MERVLRAPRWSAAILLLWASVLWACVWSVSGIAAVSRVELGEGVLEGIPSPVNAHVTVFRGVPYAAPPVRALRWRPPQPPVPWVGTRLADTFGAPCWQPRVPETSIYSRGPIEVSEDCLYLNLWTAGEPGDDRPVMVWFHGGGNTTGHGSSLVFDGTRLARKGVVVVTVNYRLGALGFLAHPALSAESEHASSGNYALLDQLAALEWVQRNATAFGGDPGRVTVFGQSAGAFDICLLMASPLAAGLLHGVIAHSGACLRIDQPLAGETGAEAAGRSLSVHLGIDPRDAAQLRAHTPEALAAAAQALGVNIGAPIVDGRVVPESPRTAFATERFNRVPLVAGFTSDEFRGLAQDLGELSMEDYTARVRAMFPGRAEVVLAHYEGMARTSPAEAFRKISTHSFFGREVRAWSDLVAASGGRSFVYYFSHPTPVFRLYIPSRPALAVEGGLRSLGAYHSGDLPYHFANLGIVGLGWEARDAEIADLITNYWVNFAASGDPNGQGLPRWHARGAGDEVLEIATGRIGTAPNPVGEELDLFD